MSERNVKTQGAKPGEPAFAARTRPGGDGKSESSGLSIDQSAASQPGTDGPPAEGWDPYDRRGRIATDPTAVPTAPRKASRIIVTSRHQPGFFERFLKKLGGGSK